MGSMRASPAGLLLLAFALICASPLSSAAVHIITAEYGGDTVKSFTHRTAHRSILSAATSGSSATSGSASTGSPQVATEVEVGATRLSFSSKRCVSVTKKAMRRNVTVPVQRKGSQQVGFGVVCPNILPVMSFDRACDALKCEPDGTCVKDQNGERYCQWDSPCGSCPTGATCKAVQSKGSIPIQVPYCECPSGYGMTATECVLGGKDTVGGNSYTFIVNRSAKDNTSRPYTLRYNTDGCTQFPAAVAGKYSTKYTVYSVKSNAYCYKYQEFSTDNCQGNPDSQLFSLEKRLDTKVEL
ncbi:unnamed protein product, partial [Closterium sp. NIES-65]